MDTFLEKVDISSGMLLVSAGLIVIGMVLKHTPSIPNWIILWILMLLGIVFNMFISGFSAETIVEGLISAGLAITAHQTVKQTKEGILFKKNKT
ncbi:MAG: phage holin family protein [Bacilli bacterium]